MIPAPPSASTAEAPAEPFPAGAVASAAVQRARHGAEPLTLSEISRALAILRVTRGWSQTDLANASGVHSSAISTYERSKIMPEMATIARLIAALSYTL